MSNTAKLKKKATELEQKKQFDKALQLYIQLLDEAGRELDDADLQLYNRVGDLLMRQGNTTEALTYYEKAVDVYAERGFLNNAIALCSKILRQSPARTAVYYKLGKISANKGFKSDAKKNFLEYADRMEKAGQRNEAFRALKEFADLCPDQDDIRLMLAEMLSKDNRRDEALDQLQTLYEKLEGEGRGAEARATLDRMKAIDPAVEPRTSGMYRAQKSNDLVFLDLTADLGGAPPAKVAPAPEPPAPTSKRLTMPEIPALEGLEFTFVPEGTEQGASDDDLALVESLAGLVSSGDDSDTLDADAIEALLTMPDASLTTLEHEAAINAQESRTPLADLEPTAVVANEAADLLDENAVGLAGWEPTAADDKPAFPTPLLVPLIDEPVLSGSAFAELDLRDANEARPTPVHDLLLPTELPLLSLPAGMAAIPTPAPRLGYEMEAVDSPSPIDISDLAEDAVDPSSFDLLSELTSPFSRSDADAAAASPTHLTDPFGIELADASDVATTAFNAGALEVVPDIEQASAVLDVTALSEPAAVSVPDIIEAASVDDAAATAAAPVAELSALTHSDDGEVRAAPMVGDVVVAIDEGNEPDGIVAVVNEEPADAQRPEVNAQPDEDPSTADVSLASIDAAFESTPAEEISPAQVSTVEASAENSVEAAADAASEESEAGLLGTSPGFGDRDPEASTFSPSPRLSALTLQPDSWSIDDHPEVLIDGEWHDEHVGDAAHVAPDAAGSGVRFDDLAAAMMWVPDENEGAADGEDVTNRTDSSPFGMPHGHVSFGGVEDQLRRRLELVPENWALRRQLGEVLLDSGDRDAGLYELDLAMVGYELSGDLLGAMEVADGIVRLVPASVRHHQKRVEYSVRAGDRVRLVDAYMELGDALFREGEPDKAQAVYARVLELSPGHERATFAIGALGTVVAEMVSGGEGALTVSDDAFAEWEPPAHVLASFVSASSGEHSIAPAEPLSITDDATTAVLESAGTAAVGDAPVEAEHAQVVTPVILASVASDAEVQENAGAPSTPDDPSTDLVAAAPEASETRSVSTNDDEITGDVEDAAVAVAADDVMELSEAEAAPIFSEEAPAETESADATVEARVPDVTEIESAEPLPAAASFDGDAEEDVSQAPALVADSFDGATEVAVSSLTPREESALDIASLKQAVEREAETSMAAPSAERDRTPEPVDASPILTRARSLTPVGSRDDEFVDLGEWLRMTEPERTTRMVVDDSRPSGDEQADFEDMLRRFKRGVAENVEEEDFASHYDLGVAYKEMGLIDEAIAQFQRALRGEHHRIKSYEALGQCFVEKGQHAVATALLQRAADSSQVDDHRLVGVLYLLGYSMEAVGRRTEALRYYQRVFAVDIEFRDVAQRVAAMEHQPT